MTDLYHRSTPVAQAKFRDNTAKRAVMLNAQIVPKRCRCVRCAKMRTEATGRQTESGFVCGMCHSPRRVS